MSADEDHRVPRRPLWLAQVPNAISTARLALAIAFPFIPSSWHLPVLLIGALSDWLDGFIARAAHLQGRIGQLLDPIADKTFILLALFTLAAEGHFAWWQALVVLLRDISVIVVAGYALVQRDLGAFARMKPTVSGKIATLFIYGWLIAALAAPAAPALETGLFVAAVLFSALAAADYTARFVSALQATA